MHGTDKKEDGKTFTACERVGLMKIRNFDRLSGLRMDGSV